VTAPGGRLRVIVVEDNDSDYLLTVRALRRSGYAPDARCVQSAAELRAALADGPWDVVISDQSLPGLSAAAASEIVREVDSEVPFLVVSGTPGIDPNTRPPGPFVPKDRLETLGKIVKAAVAGRGARPSAP
jgi:two-component system sensor histidine kinase UhpB